MYLYNPTKKIIAIMLSLFGIFCVILALSLIKMFEKPQYANIVEMYPLLSEDNVFEEVGADRIIQMIDNREDGLIVFGFPACPWCQQLLPVLDTVAKKSQIFHIFYVDIKDMRDNESSPDHEKYLYIKQKFKEILDVEHDRINAPTVVTVTAGNVIDYHLDTVPSHQMVDGRLPEMTAEQKRELAEILKQVIRPIYKRV